MTRYERPGQVGRKRTLLNSVFLIAIPLLPGCSSHQVVGQKKDAFQDPADEQPIALLDAHGTEGCLGRFKSSILAELEGLELGMEIDSRTNHVLDEAVTVLNLEHWGALEKIYEVYSDSNCSFLVSLDREKRIDRIMTSDCVDKLLRDNIVLASRESTVSISTLEEIAHADNTRIYWIVTRGDMATLVIEGGLFFTFHDPNFLFSHSISETNRMLSASDVLRQFTREATIVNLGVIREDSWWRLGWTPPFEGTYLEFRERY